MPIGTDVMDMIELRLYYASLAICGAILGAMGLSSIVSEGLALVPVLLSIGGIGMIAGVVYEAFISSPSIDTLPDERLVWFTVAMAAVGGIGGIWSLVG
ncbi:hypothetical protein [Halostagnicola larsenii]|uniref:hypothetical protein n=1 Tax=Halostagnicola larsenii TaxID=353800 RepID=UPI001F56A03C|nr:hypothetical protein [Halostagnicola larsenii]